ncbi:MAG: hypothetical protein WB816_03000 [Methylocystis sp.]
MGAPIDRGQRFEIRCDKDGVIGEVVVAYAAEPKDAQKIMDAWRKMPGVIWVRIVDRHLNAHGWRP